MLNAIVLVTHLLFASTCLQVDLPAVYPDEDLLRCAQQLLPFVAAERPPTAQELVSASKSSVATMAGMACDWQKERVALDGRSFADFAAQYLVDKLLPEVSSYTLAITRQHKPLLQ